MAFEGMLAYGACASTLCVVCIIALVVLVVKAAWCGVGSGAWGSVGSGAWGASERYSSPINAPDVLNKPYHDAIKAYRDFWKMMGPVYVMRVGTSSEIPLSAFNKDALYLWVDARGTVVDGGVWDEVGEPLQHGGFVDVLPAIGG